MPQCMFIMLTYLIFLFLKNPAVVIAGFLWVLLLLQMTHLSYISTLKLLIQRTSFILGCMLVSYIGSLLFF